MTTRHFATRLIGGIATLTATVTAAAALAGCGADTGNPVGATPDTTGSASPARTHNQADITFVTGMIPHHEQAVAMSKLAAERAGSTQVKDLAGRIESAQQPEIDQMNGFLEAWGASAASEPPMGGTNSGDPAGTPRMDHAAMPGMMSPMQLDQLGRSSGAAFDASFLRMMIGHHQGAVTMSQAELASGQSPDAKALAQRIIAAQQREITEMRAMLAG